MLTESLKVAEHFYSVQGEGNTVGSAAVFLRLSMCALDCVWCDTAAVWKQGQAMMFSELTDLFRQSGYFPRLDAGAHLIVTGGDPLIQQHGLVGWFDELTHQGLIDETLYVEVETEGVIKPNIGLLRYVKQFNVSPKLSNSGMPEFKRFKPDVLKLHVHRNNKDIFKFPVDYQNLESDLTEVRSITDQVGIPPWRVYLMPLADSHAALMAAERKVAEAAKYYGYNYSTRLHLHIWDKATGV